VVTYVRQHIRWRVACKRQTHAAEIRDLNPSGIVSFSADNWILEFARAARIPLVLVCNARTTPNVSTVFVDERLVGQMAANYLTGLGLRHFACVGHGPWAFVPQRMNGFAEAVEARGLGPVHQLVGSLYDGRRRPRFKRELVAMLQKLPRPCGVLAANDALGVEIVAACRNIGLRVPDDIAVLGVDDDDVACELSEVPLSSIAQPLVAIGYESTRLLHQHLDDPHTKPTNITLPPMRVVPRASTDLIALDDADVVSALRLINHHFTEPLNVAWIVEQLPVARRSLERRFKRLVGRTILEQIHHVRLEKAKELLAESDLSLEVVAKRSGFVNARWMADSFRRDIKITPNRFRRRLRSES
jgi:LacI family transcriptional regulator